LINLGVTAVIFVAAISEYDQKLFEDASTNRMVEALDLFEVISMDVYIHKTMIILTYLHMLCIDTFMHLPIEWWDLLISSR
jgi:hypothetical protein